MGAQPRPVAYRPFGGAARCVVTGCRIHRDVPLDPDRARRTRSARSARPRLCRVARVGGRTRHRPRGSDGRAVDRRPEPGSAVHVRIGARRRRAARVRLQGCCGDRRARRQRRSSTRPDRRRRIPPARGTCGHGGRSRARAHPVGECRDHLRGERASPEPGGARPRRWCIRRCRAERRRRQLRRSQGARSAPLPRRDHHRRQGDSRPRLAPDRRRERDRRGVPVHGRRLRRLRRHRGAGRSRARAAPARTTRERPGAVRGCRRRGVRRRERAVRRRRGVRPVPAPRWRDDARSRRTGHAGADRVGERSAGCRAVELRRLDVARRRDRDETSRDHHP